MPERLEKLRVALGELERELDSLEAVDAETRAVLEQAKQEIQGALEKPDPAEHLEPDSLIERLKATEREFEASHPTLSGVVIRMVDALGQIGI